MPTDDYDSLADLFAKFGMSKLMFEFADWCSEEWAESQDTIWKKRSKLFRKFGNKAREERGMTSCRCTKSSNTWEELGSPNTADLI